MSADKKEKKKMLRGFSHFEKRNSLLPLFFFFLACEIFLAFLQSRYLTKLLRTAIANALKIMSTNSIFFLQ